MLANALPITCLFCERNVTEPGQDHCSTCIGRLLEPLRVKMQDLVLSVRKHGGASPASSRRQEPRARRAR